MANLLKLTVTAVNGVTRKAAYKLFPTSDIEAYPNSSGTGTDIRVGKENKVYTVSEEIDDIVTAEGSAVASTYNCLLTQVTTGAPTATILGTNGIGTIVWARSSAGTYTGTLAGAFPSGKTQFFVGANGNFVDVVRTSDNVVTVSTLAAATALAADSLLTAFSLKIVVTP